VVRRHQDAIARLAPDHAQGKRDRGTPARGVHDVPALVDAWHRRVPLAGECCPAQYWQARDTSVTPYRSEGRFVGFCR